MELLYQSNNARVMLLTLPREVAEFLTVLERITAELSWQPGTQLADYQEAALHLAVAVDGEIAGGLQAVYGADVSALPYTRVWPEVELGEKTGTAHVTILALKQQYRGRPGLFGPLCVELWRCCRARGIEQIVTEATPPTLRLYRRIGWPLEIVGELRQHWGEDCYLCRMGVREVAEALTEKARRSHSYRALVKQAYRDDPGKLPLTGTVCL